jgi:hypothetical protein
VARPVSSRNLSFAARPIDTTTPIGIEKLLAVGQTAGSRPPARRDVVGAAQRAFQVERAGLVIVNGGCEATRQRKSALAWLSSGSSVSIFRFVIFKEVDDERASQTAMAALALEPSCGRH